MITQKTQEKLQSLVIALKTARTFEGAVGRSDLTKRSAMALLKDPDTLQWVSEQSGRNLTYFASVGYVSTGNGVFGHHRCNDRKAGYRPAWVSVN